MKPFKQGVAAVAIVLASGLSSFAVVGLDIAVSGTNLVLSWPSQGYEHYLIQYRPTLDPADSWSTVTNNYPANGTSRTTFTIFGVLPPPGEGGGGGGGGGGVPSPPGMSSMRAGGSDLIVYPLDDATLLTLAEKRVLPPFTWDLQGRSPFVWELEGRPPCPWDPGAGGNDSPSRGKVSLLGGVALDGNGPENGGNDSGGGTDGMGFYRVFHIPDFSSSITNHTFDGPTFLGVDFADYMDRVDNIEVLLNGEPTSDAVFTSYNSQGQTYWGMGIYFDLFPSGTYPIQLLSTIRLNDVVGDETVYLVLSNLTRTITVDNEVTFTNWDGLIMSTNFTFRAQTKTNATDWTFDIYDAWWNPVNSGSGHTSNGQIEWTWDLTDTSGNPRDNLDTDPFFYSYITYTAASGQQRTRRTPAPQTEYPSVGYWLITYADKNFIDAGSRYSGGDQYYTNGITGIAAGPAMRGIPVSVFPIKFGTNSYTQAQRNDSWAELKARLFMPQNRNFYYYGHGSANTVGADVHTFDTNGYLTGGIGLPGSKASLTSEVVKKELTFNRYSGARPYRFVWLDGCSTANGNWPGAFGVDRGTNSLAWYTNAVTNPNHRRPSAFVGWNQTVGGGGWGSIQSEWNFRSEWMQDWYYWSAVRELSQAFINARQSSSWPPNGDQQLWGALRVYGYRTMKFNEFNQKNDWRWP